jgi:mRNA interferase MazF
LLGTGNADILVARITSQDVDTDYDVRLADWAQASLLLPSVTCLHKLATLQKSLVERQLGALTQKDLSKVREKIQQIFASIRITHINHD